MHRCLATLLILAAAAAAHAEDVPVLPGESVQAALDAASDGDVLVLSAGEYTGDVVFGDRAVTIRGVGPGTVLRGTGTTSVVRFPSTADPGSALDSVTVTGGRAERGGGISITESSPTVIRCVVSRNRASAQGSGIYLSGGSRARIYNNLVIYNRRDGSGDPHGIEIVDAAPEIVNNTVARHDSNGLILRGASEALVLSNVFAHNGARVGRRLRGRGICDFSGGRARILRNVFHRNRIAAILRGGRDWKKVRKFERRIGDPLVDGNVDGRPGFRRPPLSRAQRSRSRHFELRGKGRAVDLGGGCDDADGTPNDAGHTGGAYAPGRTAVPSGAGCPTDA